MKKYNVILESSTDPKDKNVLWLQGNKLKKFGNTGWENITEGGVVTTDRIENGAVTTEKIATDAFDSTLSKSEKIAPANIVGNKITTLDEKVDALALGKFYGYFPDSSSLPTDVSIPGYAYVRLDNSYEIWNFSGESWSNSGVSIDENNVIITTDRIEDGAVTSEKIATSAFDDTLSVSGKIAPADVVGEKITELVSKVDGKIVKLINVTSEEHPSSQDIINVALKKDDVFKIKVLLGTAGIIDESIAAYLKKDGITVQQLGNLSLGVEKTFTCNVDADGIGLYLYRITPLGTINVEVTIPTIIERSELTTEKKIEENIKLFLDRKDELDNYVFIIRSKDNKILFSIDKKGNIDWKVGIPEHLQKEINKTWITANPFNTGLSRKSDTILQEDFCGVTFNNQYLPPDVNPIRYIDAAIELGAKIIMLYNSGTISTLDKCIKYCNQKGIDVLLFDSNVPDWNNTGNSALIDKSEWLSILRNMAIKYNGETITVVDGDNSKLKVKYFMSMEEMEMRYKSLGFSVKNLIEMYDESYKTIKEANSNAIIISSFLNDYSKEFFYSLLTESSTYGNKYCDTFDILNLDTYSSEPEQMKLQIENMYKDFAIYQPEILQKVQRNLTGESSMRHSDKDKAVRLIRRTIEAFAAGANSYMYYELLEKRNSKSYYGLIGPSVSNSYLSLLKNDGTDDPISFGSAYEKIILGWAFGQSKTEEYIPIDGNIASNIKKSGLKIKGKNLTSTKIYFVGDDKSTSIYDVNIGDFIFTDTSFISVNDDVKSIISNAKYLKVEYKDADTSNTPIKIEKTQSFEYIKKLHSFLHKGCSRPYIENRTDGVYVASWTDENKRQIFCLWSNNNSLIRIDCDTNAAIAHNIKGNVIDLKEILYLSNDIYFIENANKIKINKL